MKMLLPEPCGVVELEGMFLDEAKLTSRIKAPERGAAVTDVGEEDGVLYQVIEWVNGDSLWSLTRAASRRGG